MPIDTLSALWTPRIGSRVVCRPSPECHAVFPRCHAFTGIVVEWAHHDAETIGRKAVVDEVLPPDFETEYATEITDEQRAHRIHVRYDAPIKVIGGQVLGGLFAPSELSPLFALGDRIRVRESVRYCPAHHLVDAGDLGRIVGHVDSPSGHTWTIETDDGDGVYRCRLTDELADEEMMPL